MSLYCEVSNSNGEHCPDEATKSFIHRGQLVHVCDRCYQNILLGAYGREMKESAKHRGGSIMTKTTGQRIVQEWRDGLSGLSSEPFPDPDADLSRRFDQALETSRQPNTLGLEDWWRQKRKFSAMDPVENYKATWSAAIESANAEVERLRNALNKIATRQPAPMSDWGMMDIAIEALGNNGDR